MASIDNVRSGQSMTNASRSGNTPRAEKQSEHQKTEGNSPASERDAVSLSTQSKAMSEMQQTMASSPAFDSAKVQAIKDAIASGSYRVDPDKLAENIIKFEKELRGLDQN